LIIPTLCAIAALAVLVSLGTWQLQRKAWKENLLARIAARVEKPTVALGQALQIWRATADIEYLHLQAAGHFLHEREQHVYTVDARQGPGFHIYTPLVTPEGYLLLVNRGFVPADLKDRAKRPDGQVPGEIMITGLARRPTARGWFVPTGDPERNMSFWPDYATFLARAQAAGQPNLTAVPFFMDADAEPANPGGFPKGGVTRLDLPNRHLEYAITWFGLGATLIGVYFSFALGRLRSRKTNA
jgi:surfeit locus 1 family protein